MNQEPTHADLFRVQGLRRFYASPEFAEFRAEVLDKKIGAYERAALNGDLTTEQGRFGVLLAVAAAKELRDLVSGIEARLAEKESYLNRVLSKGGPTPAPETKE